MGRQSGLEIELEVDLGYETGRTSARHVEQIESTIYRLVQEALTNVIKHAEARRVRVEVTDHDEVIELRVTDDGRGFDRDAPGDGGFGLLGMRERVGLVHGSLEIESTPGGGTSVRAVFPSLRRPDAPASWRRRGSAGCRSSPRARTPLTDDAAVGARGAVMA